MASPKRQPLRPVAFRLLNELDGLLQGIKADGVINEQETLRLRRWLKENEDYTWIHPFSELDNHIATVLADGHVTVDECEDLLFVIHNLTTDNPYFDALRRGLQVLMGLLGGVSADGVLRESEVRALSDWVQEWEPLRGLWPFDECHTIVTAMLAEGTIAEYRDHLFDLARQFPVAGAVDESTGELPPVLVKGICAVDPEITFDGRMFVFTGESRRARRSQLEGLVQSLGGQPWPRVTEKINYLIVCESESPHWAFSCYGRKTEHVYNLRREGHPAVIAHERDFWDAVASSGMAV